MFVYPEDRKPSNTVRLAGATAAWPASWRIEGPAYGFTDWRVEVHGGIPHQCGEAVDVVLKTALGELSGRAHIAGAVMDELGLRHQLVGDGQLSLAP